MYSYIKIKELNSGLGVPGIHTIFHPVSENQEGEALPLAVHHPPDHKASSNPEFCRY